MINENILRGNWKQIKGEMQRAWGNITNDEWDRAQGSATALSGLVQKRYGISQEEVETKFNEIVSHFDADKKASSEDSKNETPSEVRNENRAEARSENKPRKSDSNNENLKH